MLKLLAATGSSAVVALGAAAAVAAAPPGKSPDVQKIGFTILPGDRITEANVALAPGVPVRMTVTNYTREFHTFTIPALHISRLILPADGHSARTTTFTLTLDTWGPVAWRCIICPSGEHGRKRTMGGTFYVIIDRSTVT